MSTNAASPKIHVKQKSVGTIVVKNQITVGKRPDRPPPVPMVPKQPQSDNKLIPVDPVVSQVAPQGSPAVKYEFVPIDIDEMLNKLNEEIHSIPIPGQTVEEAVVQDGLTPSPPDENSTSNSRSDSIVSDNSSMSNTHGSQNSPRQNTGGGLSPRKFSTIPSQIIDNSTVRSASAGHGNKRSLELDLKEKMRFHSTPEKPETKVKITTPSPRKQPAPLPENVELNGTNNNLNIVQPTPVISGTNGPSSLPTLPAADRKPFGLDSYSEMDSPVRPLSSSSNVISPPKSLLNGGDSTPTTPKGSPGTHKKKILNADGIIIVSKLFVMMIKGGVLEKIIDYLVKNPTRETDSINALLLNYRKYISPSQLLDILFSKLYNAKNETTSSSDQVMLRCVNTIQYWVSSHYHDFADDQELLSDLQERLTKLNDPRANPILKTIKQQEAKYKNLMAKPPMTILNPNAKKVNLLELKPIVVAQQLCLFEHELFRAIHPKEFLNQNWEKHKEKAPNICRMVQWFNAVSEWIAAGILQASTTKEREKLTKFWIEVADHCRMNNNFNAIQEIISAFSSNAIYRLKPLWEKINKSKKTSTVLENLRQLIHTDNNYKEYREALKSVVGACIPFMSLILRDLIHIEDGNPNILPVEGRTDIINFDKAMKISSIIGAQSPSILGFQTELYKFLKVEAVYNIFNNGLCVLSDEERYQLSLKIVPKKTK